jgi:UDP-N-acetylmuramoyl-L-alanyl-D-glutamate--2,6-diaminopimelate ligase
VRLSTIVERGLAREARGDADVRGVHHDSRAVEAGDLFFALAGKQSDGARFANDAIARGAVAIATERWLDVSAPQVLCDDARRQLGPIAHAVYGDPTASLRLVGVTGTNGKTTTTWIIDDALRALGEKPALLGTVEARVPGRAAFSVPFTTPEADAIARFGRDAVQAGATHLVMEISSHALAQHRTGGVRVDVAAFSNLTQDHLDFHGTMDAYFEAKALLFTELAPRASVINVDTEHGVKMAERAPGAIKVSKSEHGDLVVRTLSMGRDGIRARVVYEGRELSLESPLIGAHNLDNLLLALGCLVALGVSFDDAVGAIGSSRGAPGRLERVSDDPMVLVDYAHTPDALARALDAVRPITPGRLIVVFGCGGDRDQGKRPKMGRAAAEGADAAIVTSDNPRTEDPLSILEMIEPGVIAGGLARGSIEARAYEVEVDRRAAIVRAISVAKPGDTVLIAGKGHEDYQIRGTTKHHFDDREEARAAIGGQA